MSTHASTGLYDEDLYCSNPNNVITNELQTLQTPGLDDYYFIIPHAAPFFVETLEVRNHQTGQLYVEGTDYLIGHYFVDAMRSLKRPLAGSIRFLRKNISGTVRLKYHTVGGQWGFSADAVLEELASKQLNPIVRSWEQIDVIPQKFPTIDHDQSVDQLVGSEDIVEAIDRIGDILEATAAGTSESHINDRNNPHQVTKVQVELGLVQNYGIATLAQALDPNLNTVYLTPRAMHHALETLVVSLLEDHVNDRDNPHGTNKTHVGLSNVPNLPLANASQAVDPLNNSAFMSPYTTALMVQSLIPTDRLDDLELALQNFIDRRDNPHQVTAAQVGTLTTAEIQALIVSAGSGEAITFNGYTFDQFMDLVVEEDEMVDILQQMAVAYGSHNADLMPIGNDTINDIATTNITRDSSLPIDITTGVGGYIVVHGDNSGSYKSIHPTFLVDAVVRGGDSIAFHTDRAYGISNTGGVIALLAGTPEVENTYNGNHTSFDPANAAQAVYATQTACWIYTEDDRLVRSTGPAQVAVIASGVEELWLNTEYKQLGEFVVYKTSTGFFAAGDAAFVTAFNAWKTSRGAAYMAEVIEFALTDSLFAHSVTDAGGSRDTWVSDITRTDGAISFTNTRTLGGDNTDLSGNGDHVVVLDSEGNPHFAGILEADETAMVGPYATIAAGGGFTVAIDTFGFIEFWGDSPNNRLHYNERWEMKDV